MNSIMYVKQVFNDLKRSRYNLKIFRQRRQARIKKVAYIFLELASLGESILNAAKNKNYWIIPILVDFCRFKIELIKITPLPGDFSKKNSEIPFLSIGPGITSEIKFSDNEIKIEVRRCQKDIIRH